MTLTRWLFAGVLALTLGVSGGYGQTCARPGTDSATPPCSASPSPCRTTPDCYRAVRAPYYNEVADILFPTATPTPETASSSPVACQGLFNAVAHCQAEKADQAHRALIRMARFCLATGHYGTAEHYARLARNRQPNSPEAQHVLVMACAARALEMVSDHEACEEQPAACAKCKDCKECKGCKDCKDKCCCGTDKGCADCKNCACGKAGDKAKCATACKCNKDDRDSNCRTCEDIKAVEGCKKNCCGCTKTSEAKCALCAMNCQCNKDGGCEKDCCCGQEVKATAACKKGCCQPAAKCALCAMACQCNKDGGCEKDCCCGQEVKATAGCNGCCVKAAVKDCTIDRPCVVVKGCVCPCVPAVAATPLPACCNVRGAIRIASKQFEITCDALEILPGKGDRLLLRGNASVNFKMDGRPARIEAERIILNLTDGSFEVNPAVAPSLFNPYFIY